jgi:hypothetical protein
VEDYEEVSTMSFNSYVNVLDQDGEEHEIEVRIEYDAVYEPAFVSGPIEDCYPDSSEMDLTEITSINDLPQGITDEMVQEAAENSIDRLQQEAWDDFLSGDKE